MSSRAMGDTEDKEDRLDMGLWEHKSPIMTELRGGGGGGVNEKADRDLKKI